MYTFLQIGVNGIIVFPSTSDIVLEQLPGETPKQFPRYGSNNSPIIAVYWANAMLDNLGRIYHEESTNRGEVKRAVNEIREAFGVNVEDPGSIFIVTWVDIKAEQNLVSSYS